MCFLEQLLTYRLLLDRGQAMKLCDKEPYIQLINYAIILLVYSSSHLLIKPTPLKESEH